MFKSNQLFLNNFSIYFLGLIFSGLISFVTIPLIVKYYGIESYGKFSLVQNVILVLISFGGGWLNQCVLRFNDYSTNFKFTIFQFYFILFLPLSFVCFGILMLMKVGILISILGIIIMLLGSLAGISIVFFQSKFNARKSFYFDFIRILIFVLMVLTFHFALYQTTSLVHLVFSFFISYLMSFFFMLSLDFKFFKISVGLFIKKFNKEYFVVHLKQHNYLFHYGWPLALWFSISSILNVSDRYIIDYYLTDNELGIYSSIYDLLYKGVSLLCSPILIAGYPILSQKFNQGNKKEAYQFLKKLVFLEVIFFLVVLLIGFFFRSFFIKNIIGIPVSHSSLGLIIPIICGSFVWQLAMLVHKPLEYKLKTKIMLVFIVLSLLINVTLNLVFISKIGIIFPAYSTLFASIFYLLLNIIYIKCSKKSSFL